MSKKKTTEQFKQEVYDLVGDEYTVLGEYKDCKKSVEFQHHSNICGNSTFSMAPDNFKQRKFCPNCKRILKQQEREEKKKCEKERKKENFRIKREKNYKKRVAELGHNEFEVLGKYVDGQTPIRMKHIICGYIYDILPDSFSGGCENCAGHLKKTTEQFKQEVYDLVGDEYTVLGEYIDSDTPIKMRHNCDKCHNHIYYPIPYNFLAGYRCKECFATKKKTTEQFKQEVYDLVGDEYTVLGEYKGSNDPIRMRHNCDKCHNYDNYWVSPNNFLYNNCRCNYCAGCSGTSHAEFELREYIESLVETYSSQYSKRILDNNLDIDILTKNNIGFEFNGLYWHCELHKSKSYHIDKTNNALKKGYRLIHIFEDEWEYKKDIVKSKIKHILNVDNNPVIGARKCSIKELNTKKLTIEKDDFLDKNHIQGKDKSSIKLGLYFENLLVAVMTFVKSRYDKSYDYELSRFATSIHYKVPGAFGKLFNYFKNHYDWNSIITYADKCWSQGNVYLTNGWTYLRDTDPSYSYIKPTNHTKIRYNRENYQKHKLLKSDEFKDIKGKTELEIMNNAGYYRIWNCGNMAFEYKR